MIRRDDPPAQPDHWILIEQPEHARVAGMLAEHWGAGEFLPLADRQAVLWAAIHHDDGWRDWERHPDVNDSGQPRAFTEMRPADSLTIWIRSIEIAAAAGPLEGYVVAGHFRTLAQRAALFLPTAEQQQLARAFIEQQTLAMTFHLASWQQGNPQRNTTSRAEVALKQLQLFDALSLWFCCTPSDDAETVETPGNLALTLKRLVGGKVQLEPWPLAVSRLEIEASGRRMPVGLYQNAAELAAVTAQPIQLRWQLQPDSG